MTIEQANEAIEAVCKFLQRNSTVNYDNARLEGTLAQDARSMAYKLLNSASCDGMSGCKLCQN